MGLQSSPSGGKTLQQSDGFWTLSGGETHQPSSFTVVSERESETHQHSGELWTPSGGETYQRSGFAVVSERG